LPTPRFFSSQVWRRAKLSFESLTNYKRRTSCLEKLFLILRKIGIQKNFFERFIHTKNKLLCPIFFARLSLYFLEPSTPPKGNFKNYSFCPFRNLINLRKGTFIKSSAPLSSPKLIGKVDPERAQAWHRLKMIDN